MSAQNLVSCQAVGTLALPLMYSSFHSSRSNLEGPKVGWSGILCEDDQNHFVEVVKTGSLEQRDRVAVVLSDNLMTGCRDCMDPRCFYC